MVGPAVPGGNIGGNIVLTGVPQFLANANRITKAYQQIAAAAQNTSNIVARSPVAAGKAPPAGAGATSVKPRVGGFVGGKAQAGPFQTALGVGGFGAGPVGIAVAGITAIGVAAAATTAKVLSLGSAFQESQREVQVFGEVSNKEMESLNQTILKLSITWGVSAQAISEAAVSLIKAGATIDQVNGGLLEQVVILNRASKGEVEMARGADILVQLMTLYHPEVVKSAAATKDYAEFNRIAEQTVNTLTGAVQKSTVGWEEFILQSKNVAPVGALLGFSFDDVATSLAVLNQAGIRGETAGTALRNSWLRMIKPTKEAAETMDKYGISLFNADGTMIDAEESVRQLENAFGDQAVASGKLTAAERTQALGHIFNTRQILASVTIAKQGTDAYDKMKTAIAGVNARQIAADLQFGINPQLELLKTGAEAAGIALFNGLEVPLTNLLKVINKFATDTGFFEFASKLGVEIGNIISLNNEFTNTWIKLAAVQDTLLFQAFGNLLTVLGKVATAISGGLGLTSATDALRAFGDVTITISAILEVASENLITSTDVIIAWVAGAIGTVTEIFNIVAAEVSRIAPIIAGGFIAVGNAIGAGIALQLENVRTAVNSIITLWDTLTEANRAVAATMTEGWDADVVFFTELWNNITSIFSQAFTNLTTGVGAAVEGIISIWNALSGGLFDVVVNAIVPILDGLILAMQNTVAPIVAAIGAWVTGWKDWLNGWIRVTVEAVNKVLNALRKIAAVGAGIPGLNAIDASFKLFDELSSRLNAAGGNVAEAGVELGNDLGAMASGVAKGASVGAGIIAKGVEDFGKRVRAQIDATRASVNEAFGKLQTTLQAPRPDRPPVGATPGKAAGAGGPLQPNTPPGKGGGGGAGGKEDVDQLAQRILDALSGIIPAMTRDLAEFMAGIAKDFPARLQPMINALVEARGIIGEMVLLKRDMVAVDLQLIGVEQRIKDLQAEQHRIQLQADIASIGFDKQLLQLNFQKLEVERQMWPLQDAIRDIDEQIAVLQRENLVLSRQRLETELEMLPIKQKIEDIEKRITELSRENLKLAAERLRFEGLSLPIKNQIAALDKQIERVGQRNFTLERESLELTKQQLPLQRQIQLLEDQITDSVDKRQQLLTKKQSLLAEKDVSSLNTQLKTVTDQLETAWSDFDVPKILKLEESKRLLDEQLKAAQNNLDKINTGQEDAQRDADIANTDLEIQIAGLEELLKPLDRRQQAIEHTQAVQENLNAITKLGLEEQKAGLEAILQPWQDIIDLIDQENELEQFRAKVVINGLEQEKAALEKQLEPLNNKLQAIQREVDLENLRNQITITHLEEEKRALEDQLKPLENQRRAIERTTREVEFQRTAARQAFEELMLQNKEKLLAEELNRTSLEETRAAQEKTFLELFKHFQDAVTASGAFTLQEAAEVQKRLGLWDSQNDKLLENVVMFARLQDSAKLAADAINGIPRDVTITVTTVYKTQGSPGPGTPSVGPITVNPGPPEASAPPSGGGLRPAQNFQHGGIVRGPFGQPMWVIAHAGERILPLATVPHRSDFIRGREAAASTTQIVYNNITNFEVNPSYSQVDSPVSIREDLRALVMAMR